MNAQARCGELRLRCAQRGDKTALVENFFRTPLQVMKPISDATGCLFIYLLSPTGGIVQGDEYHIDIVVEANAHLIFTTQAATKVYRMPDCGASQVVNIEIQPGGILEWIPDALILFRDADFCQEINITLHPGALLLMHDLIMPGRLTRGEVLAFQRYHSRLTVRDQHGLLLYEPLRLHPKTDDCQQIGILEGYHCWGNWYLLGSLNDYGISADQFCRDNLPLFDQIPGAIGSLSALYRDGICARMVSDYVSPMHTCFEALRQQVRTGYLNLPYHALRK